MANLFSNYGVWNFEERNEDESVTESSASLPWLSEQALLKSTDVAHAGGWCWSEVEARCETSSTGAVQEQARCTRTLHFCGVLPMPETITTPSRSNVADRYCSVSEISPVKQRFQIDTHPLLVHFIFFVFIFPEVDSCETFEKGT